MKIYRVGIVGAGHVSAYHVRALQSLENVEIVGITDLDLIRGTKVASDFEIPFFKTTQEMYSAKPDVVHVLTPPSSHYALAIGALEMGCHVFVEKPMAVSEEECDLMIKKAASVQRVLSVDHSARFGPAVRKALDSFRRVPWEMSCLWITFGAQSIRPIGADPCRNPFKKADILIVTSEFTLFT